MEEKKKQGFWFIFIRVYFVILVVGVAGWVFSFFDSLSHVTLKQLYNVFVGGFITALPVSVPIYLWTMYKRTKNGDKGEVSVAHDQQMITEHRQRREGAKRRKEEKRPMSKFNPLKSFIRAYLIGLAIWGILGFWMLFSLFIMGRSLPSEMIEYIFLIPVVNFFCAIPIFILMLVIYLSRDLIRDLTHRRSLGQHTRDKQFNARMDKKFPGLTGLDHAKSVRDARNETIEERREFARKMNEVRIREGIEPWDPKKTERWINLEISAFDE